MPALRNPKVIEAFGQDVPHWKGKNIASARFPDKPAAPSVMTEFNAVVQVKLMSIINQYITGEQIDMNTLLRTAAEPADQTIAQALATK